MKKTNKDIINDFQAPFKYNSEDGYIFDANHKTFLDMGKVYDAHLWKAQRATALTIVKALNSQAVAEKILNQCLNSMETDEFDETGGQVLSESDLRRIFAENGVK